MISQNKPKDLKLAEFNFILKLKIIKTRGFLWNICQKITKVNTRINHAQAKAINCQFFNCFQQIIFKAKASNVYVYLDPTL